MSSLCLGWRCDGETIGFVPTMGALHEGHLSLARAARQGCDRFVASIFVNPTQFGQNEDLGQYPRPFERDCEMLRDAGCDILFAPSTVDIYGPRMSTHVGGQAVSARQNTREQNAPQQDSARAVSTIVEVTHLSAIWEGAMRPGHLRGVATVVAILFNIVRPDRAYFGEKDYQQLKVIEHMVRDLHFDLEIVPVETVREADGLALSSRNAYLARDEREACAVLSQALKKGVATARGGERDVAKIEMEMQAICDSQPLVKVQYLAIVDAETLAPLQQLDGRAARILVAARAGKTRLIDNMAI